MGEERETWSVSTSRGVEVGTGILLSVLAEHHERLLASWRGLTPDQWEHASRNERWSVHETVRHVADAMDRGNAASVRDGDLEPLHGFDPRSTPNRWLALSDDESPAATVERFDVAAGQFRESVRRRLASSDDAVASTVYGEAHWTMNVAHLLWDSWIHERDVLLPLGIQQRTSDGEERLVGLYGLFMSAVPTSLAGQAVSVIVELVGRDRSTLSLTCDGRQIACRETPGAIAAATGEHGPVIDALAGRGRAVDEALPGAPMELGFLAAYFNS